MFNRGSVTPDNTGGNFTNTGGNYTNGNGGNYVNGGNTGGN
jgi:hypothetical protein